MLKEKTHTLLELANEIDREYLSKNVNPPISYRDSIIKLAKEEYGLEEDDLVMQPSQVMSVLAAARNSSCKLSKERIFFESELNTSCCEYEELFLIGLLNLIKYN